MRHPRRRAAAALTAAAFVLVSTACAGSDEGDSGEDPGQVRLYGSDGVMHEGFGAGLADGAVLTGMKGTVPLNELPTEFTNRLREHDPGLDGYRYAGETYDAVVIGALAAELAGTPEPEVVRDYVSGVTAGGEQCTTVSDCLELARDGQQVEYRGVTLDRGGFTDLGEPATASFATLHFGSDGTIDDDRTEFVGAGDATETTGAQPPEPAPGPPSFRAEPLRFGGLLPQTGPRDDSYPAMAAAAQLAVDEINEAGGVFGVDVEWSPGDDGSLDPEVARATLAGHIDDDVHIIIGAGASEVTEAVLPDVAAAQRILISPASGRSDLSSADHDGYFFRTAPPDNLQGAALADIMLRDGVQRVVIVARDEPYGLGLQDATRDALVGLGVATSEVTLLTYQPPPDPELPVPDPEPVAGQVVDARPDAVLVIGDSEAGQVIQAMIDSGLPIPA